MVPVSGTSIVYGPIISWRLGRSLGIDPILPPKVCTFDCIYCQLGRTKNKVASPAEFKPRAGVEDLTKSLEEALRGIDVRFLDYVTFSGCGEPTLHPELGEMIEAVRELCPSVPIAILTNSSLFWLDEVADAVRKADLVVAKLDAADPRLMREINRPAEGLELEMILEGLREVGKKAGGRLAIQSMFLRAHGRPLNTGERELELLVEALRPIGPYQIQVNTPTRPPAEAYVEALTGDELRAVADFLSGRLAGVEVIFWHPPRPGPISARAPSLRKAILAILEHRPCRFHELCSSTGSEPTSVRAELDRLISDGLVSAREYRGERFYALRA
ncbi:hypothetical protein DRO32_03550 [Candidatus Bathyarchaeota archaeon]|nr:MAG: hypothetical protein DRO32_03550 [Candidatus Bathyarchaeota archaeon]